MQKQLLLIVILGMAFVGKAQNNAFVFDGVSAFNEGMAAVEKDKKFGFIDSTGKLVIPIIFEKGEYDTPEFKNGIAVVKKDKKYGVINKKGQLIVPLKYTYIEPFFNGFAQVTNNSYKVGYINSRGQEFIPCMYEKISGVTHFINGLVPLQLNKSTGYADTTGKMVVPFKYHSGDNFKDGLALVKSFSYTSAFGGTTKIGFINNKGEEIIPLMYDDAWNLGNGFVSVNTGAKIDPNQFYLLSGGNWGVFDVKGKSILPIEYSSVDAANNGVIIASKGKDNNEIMYVFDYMGNPIFNQQCNSIKSLHNDRLFLSKKDGKEFAIFDKKGKQITDFAHRLRYFNTYSQSNFLVVEQPVGINKYKVGYIDINGKTAIPFKYDYAYNFNNGLAVVKLNDKYGVINEKDNTVIPLEYNFLGDLKNGFYVAKNSEGKFGFINKQGKPLNIQLTQNLPSIELDVKYSEPVGKIDSNYNAGFIYDKFTIANFGATLGTDGFYKGGKWGVVDRNYKVLIPAVYDAIEMISKQNVFVLHLGKRGYSSRVWNSKINGYDLNLFYDTISKPMRGFANFEGKILTPPSFDQVYANTFNKCYIVRDATTLKYGVLSGDFTIQIKPQYEKIRFFLNDSLFLVEENNFFGVVNLKNQLVQPFMFLYSDNADKTLYPNCFELSNKTKKIIINKSGFTIKEENVTSSNATSFKDYDYDRSLIKNLVLVNKGATKDAKGNLSGGKWGVVNNAQQIIVPIEYDCIYSDTANKVFYTFIGRRYFFKERYTIINGKTYAGDLYVDTVGKVLEGAISYEGKLLHKPTLSKVYKYHDLFVVQESSNSKCGVTDNQFNYLITPQYEDILGFAEKTNVLIARLNNKYGIINSQNQVLQPFEYNTLSTLGTNEKALYPNCYALNSNTKRIIVNPLGVVVKEDKIQPSNNNNSNPTLSNNYANFEKEFRLATNSEERGKIYAKLLDENYLKLDAINFNEMVKTLNPFVASIDFYSLHEMSMKLSSANLSKIVQVLTANLTPQQKTVFKLYSQCVIDKFSQDYGGKVYVPGQTNTPTPAQTNQTPIICPPPNTPQPGQPWKQ